MLSDGDTDGCKLDLQMIQLRTLQMIQLRALVASAASALQRLTAPPQPLPVRHCPGGDERVAVRGRLVRLRQAVNPPATLRLLLGLPLPLLLRQHGALRQAARVHFNPDLVHHHLYLGD